jgi:tRNA dimethylallyltransferase
MSFNLVVILGPTAVGKTKLAAQLAHRFNGEIISADSRQVYKRMDIGTGKDLADYCVEDAVVPYHLIDIAEPGEEYNLFLYKQDFLKIFDQILSNNKLPFLTGGTGLYLSSVVQNYKLAKADFNEDIDILKGKSIDELSALLLALNPRLHNTTDLLIKDRIIKAIQIAKAEAETDNEAANPVKPFIIGVQNEREVIKHRITARLKFRLQNGMIEEIENLMKEGISYDKLVFFGLEYKYIAEYLAGNISYNDMFQKLNSSIHNFAKRQMTWFRKMEREGVVINWIEGPDFDKAAELIYKGLENIEK